MKKVSQKRQLSRDQNSRSCYTKKQVHSSMNPAENQMEDYMLDEKILKVYEENLEDQPVMSESVLEAYDNLRSALDEYIEAVSQNVFCWAYELGRKAGKTNER